MLKQIQRLPFAPIVALMFAGVAAILVLATPVWLLEHAVQALGLPDLLAAAAPPLGQKARFMLVILAGGSAGFSAFLAAIPFHDAKPRKPHAVTVPPLRRANVEGPAFNRPSVFASGLTDDEPNLPSFLAQPLAQLNTDSLPVAGNDDDELLLDSLMMLEDADAAAAERLPMASEAAAAPVFLIDPPHMPDIFIQSETVLHLEPAPVPPPPEPVSEDLLVAPRPRIVEHREPTVEELMERFQRGLETLKRADTSPLDDATLRDALSKLERFAVGGR